MSTKVSGRRDAQNIMVTTGPDVLYTPMGSGMVPVPYSVVAYFDPSVRLSSSVRNNSLNDFQMNTRASKITGHEPGTGKGVVVPGYLTYSHVKTASSTVFSEGWAVVRDGDPAWINHPDVGPTEPRRQMAALGCRNIDSYVVTQFSGAPSVICGYSCPDGSIKERTFDGTSSCPQGHIF